MTTWGKYRLGDVAEIIMGQSPKGDSCNKDNRGVPLLNGPTEFGLYYPVPVQYTIDPKKVSEKKDILFCVRGSTTGRMNFSDQKYAIGRGIAAIRGKQDNTKFCKYIIDYYLNDLLNITTGSTFPNLSKNDLNDFEVDIPPLPEQRRIAEILGSLDDKIELNLEMNKTLEQMAMLLYKRWFVDEAKTGLIGDYIKVQGGYAFKSKDFNKQGNSGIIKIKNISMGYVDISNIQFVDEDIVKTISQDKFKIKSCDILIAMTGAEIGKIGIVENTNKDIWVNQRVGKIIEKVPYGSLVAYLAYREKEGQEYIKNVCSGSAQENISSSDLEAMEFESYDKRIVDSFGKTVYPLFEKIKFNLAQNRLLAEIRDTLLPKLISGEVRVKV
ncbi:restriction endonuclease subunit S [Bacteroidetes/Chlorobi group bacterium ChocPot_Mid]|nr:MAG: restriction endonuclease subunit S [Bacteroidetes/Chlorobi group bacterium ChocPot_Mid]